MTGGNLTHFPAFLRLEYDENGAFAKFNSNVASSTAQAEREFKRAGDQIDRYLTAALTRPRTASGAIDLGVPELHAAAAAADERARAAREVATATVAAARAEGDYSAAARTAIAAAQGLANEEQQAAIAARNQASAAEQVQEQLDRQAAASTRLSVSTRKSSLDLQLATRSSGAARAGMQQLSYQVGDVTQQFALGINPMTIFAQQSGQVAQAVALMGSSAQGSATKFGKFASFLGGPWGAAIIGATSIAGVLISSLYNAETASDAATAGANALADAQSSLGDIFDFTSGAIQSQNELLLANARLKAANLRADAVTKRASFQDTLASSGDQSARSMLVGLGVQGAPNAPSTRELRKQQIEVNNLLRQVRGGTLGADRGVQIAEKLDISRLAISRNQLLQSIIDITSADASDEAARLIDKSLDQGELASELRRSSKPKKPPRERKGPDLAKQAAREAERLDTMADRAAESIARINAAFDDQPTLVDRAAKAVRDLDAVMKDLNDPKNAKLDPAEKARLIAEAEAAKFQAGNAVNAELNRTIEANEKSLNLLSLQARGLGDQAEVLRRITEQDERLGLTAALKKLEQQRIEAELQLTAEKATNGERAEAQAELTRIAATTGDIAKKQDRLRTLTEQTVEAERRYAAEAARTQHLLDARLDTVRAAYTGIEDILSGQGTAGNLLDNIKGSFDRLRGASLADAIFGDAFDQLADKAAHNTPLGKATDALRGEVDRNTGSLGDLASAIEASTARIAKAGGLPGVADTVGGAANDNSGEPTIVVQGRPIRYDSSSINELADAMGISIAGPLTQGLNQVFGTSFFSHLQNTFGGAVSGYAKGGAVGGMLGALQGGVTDLFKGGLISEKFSKGLDAALDGALGGAQTGQQISGLANALGIKLNGTGSSIGGAIGSFIPIPGGEIIGSILGGLVGNLFGGKKKYGTAALGGSGSSIAGNDNDARSGAGTLGDSVTSTLDRIVKQFDAKLGSYAVSIGTYKDEYRVSDERLFRGAPQFQRLQRTGAQEFRRRSGCRHRLRGAGCHFRWGYPGHPRIHEAHPAIGQGSRSRAYERARLRRGV